MKQQVKRKLGFWGWSELFMAVSFLIFFGDNLVRGYSIYATIDLIIALSFGYQFYRRLRFHQ
ncbi:MAG: hypothetical protein A2655_01525 [Candidatus Yanofskybacteria bacterium RIFCSPHIGHO2_01_FULL_43_42]|uniref:Uncharacterized protein n=1 Tax=Candidatus Yanofskybacteria bacterium RIFCSPLOWO2_01_FULL_43_22 TaxID=1802695 RepID=A0A1F8GGP9_9BACT|nr:MAG: hypothetical protein A2655_01525 [Candidatus Yanofskybacteria bacterium RIFCSPHIGHO2_01_FULL_43_42]OGN13161.1 MAG: hypothetical protein A3D48_02435 [Candidatus Yanofskybacteria bacterium RIFCSPHIGHO2_02_FULL_43_17]OGN24575.1 MAG: hypothetical protein A3A13_00655 [Candidatus Yanofskybacteria bacterium RIFCSPLOWO2_01_FULL_43_22]